MTNLGTIVRGDYESFNIGVLDAAGSAQDLTGCSLLFTLKRSNDGTAAFYQGTPSISSPASAGSAVLNIPGTALAGVFVTEVFYYDLQLTDAALNPYTVDRGTLEVQLDTTV